MTPILVVSIIGLLGYLVGGWVGAGMIAIAILIAVVEALPAGLE